MSADTLYTIFPVFPAYAGVILNIKQGLAG